MEAVARYRKSLSAWLVYTVLMSQYSPIMRSNFFDTAPPLSISSLLLVEHTCWLAVLSCSKFLIKIAKTLYLFLLFYAKVYVVLLLVLFGSKIWYFLKFFYGNPDAELSCNKNRLSNKRRLIILFAVALHLTFKLSNRHHSFCSLVFTVCVYCSVQWRARKIIMLRQHDN